ncbi:hypothetical protein [Mesobacillus jeotgali]|uniref:hypothetical protein n=1 Tax=Mesobacillus jeotgali TaxID=129985 RepID=UPI0009A90401|nr:hypothetical protein [Mesobacillus jeotgali]
MQSIEYEKLLNEYRLIWNNRRLDSCNNPEETLRDAILRDLKDENSHPRARRPLKEKYYLATKRVIESSLACESKTALIQIHLELAEAIQQCEGN